MTPEEEQRADKARRVAESKERISNPDNDLLKTEDVGRMLHRSPACIFKMLKADPCQIPEYALPKKLHPNQRGYMWSKKAINRWIRETMEGAA